MLAREGEEWQSNDSPPFQRLDECHDVRGVDANRRGRRLTLKSPPTPMRELSRTK